MKTIKGHDVKIFTDNIEENALEQIKTLLSIDVFSDRKIRIMPDVHAGAGCVIGFTGDLGDKVIPNIVGVDIGCGMRILKLGRLSGIQFHSFNEFILENVPSGMRVREEKKGFKPLAGEEMEIYREAKQLVTELRCYRELKDSESVNDFTRDESPMVYKPASEIIANIGPTVDIETIIRPIFNFKAS